MLQLRFSTVTGAWTCWQLRTHTLATRCTITNCMSGVVCLIKSLNNMIWYYFTIWHLVDHLCKWAYGLHWFFFLPNSKTLRSNALRNSLLRVNPHTDELCNDLFELVLICNRKILKGIEVMNWRKFILLMAEPRVQHRGQRSEQPWQANPRDQYVYE